MTLTDVQWIALLLGIFSVPALLALRSARRRVALAIVFLVDAGIGLGIAWFFSEAGHSLQPLAMFLFVIVLPLAAIAIVELARWSVLRLRRGRGTP